MGIDGIQKQLQINELSMGKSTGSVDAETIINSVFEKMASHKHSENCSHELLDPDEFAKKVLSENVDGWDRLGKREKAELIREFKLELVEKIYSMDENKKNIDFDKLTKEQQDEEIANYDLRMRGAIWFIQNHDGQYTLKDYFGTKKITENGKEIIVPIISPAQKYNAEYNACKELIADKPLIVRGKHNIEKYAQAEKVVQRYEFIDAVAMQKADGDKSKLHKSEDYYEFQLEYLEEKLQKGEKLNKFEQETYNTLKGMKDSLGTLKKVKFGNEDDGVQISYLTKLKADKDIDWNSSHMQSTLRSALVNDLKGLSDEEKLAKMQEILGSSANIFEYKIVMDMLAELSNPKKGEAIITGEMIMKASEAAGATLHPTMMITDKMKAEDQKVVSTRVIEEVGKGAKGEECQFADETIKAIAVNWVPGLNESVQEYAAKGLIDTKHDIIINNAGEMISLLADNPAKSVYEYVVNPNSGSNLTDEQRGRITSDAHEFCSAEGYAHPDRLAQFGEIESQYGYNYSTGEYNVSNNTTVQDFGYNQTGEYVDYADYENVFSMGNSYATNSISNDKNENGTLFNLLYGDEANSSIILQINSCSNPQERKELLEKLPEYVVLNLVQSNPNLINDLKGTGMYNKALNQLEFASASDVSLRANLERIKNENQQV